MALLDPLTNLPRPQKIIAGVVGLLIVGGLGWALLISPKTSERDALRQQNEALQREVAKTRADEANLRPFRALAEALRVRLHAAQERLPSEKEMPRLYRQLTDLAFQSGLQVALFAPKAPQDRDDVAEVPIAITCEGGYHQLGAFFTRVSRLPRIVDLNDFRLVGIERPTGTLRAELMMGTFLFRPEGVPAATKPGAETPARSGSPAPPRSPAPPKPPASPAVPGGKAAR
jgi:type IV pilus assembly protein PilO